MTENLFQPNSIRTFTGKYLDFTNIKEDDICIEDIAHSLSIMPRFAGHTKLLLSVGFHSICCSRIIEYEHKLAALLHDSSEAYMCDIPKPLKDLMPGYKRIENRLMKVIAAKFGFQYPLHDRVKEVDFILLQHEWSKYMLADYEMPSPEAIENDFLKYYIHYK